MSTQQALITTSKKFPTIQKNNEMFLVNMYSEVFLIFISSLKFSNNVFFCLYFWDRVILIIFIPFPYSSQTTQRCVFIFFFNPSSIVCAAHILWLCGLHWRLVNPPGSTPLKQTKSSNNKTTTTFPLSQWLSAGLCVQPPLSMLGLCLVWACTGIMHAVETVLYKFPTILSTWQKSRLFKQRKRFTEA